MNLKGIGLFGMSLLRLISLGKKESIANVEEHLSEKNIVEFIYGKYKNDFSIDFNNTLYDNKALNMYFSKYNGYIEGNESRKYGITNEDDGLLLLIALIMEQLELKSVNWEI